MRHDPFDERESFEEQSQSGTRSRRTGRARRSARAASRATVDQVTVQLNAERNGVEIHFPDKPDEATRDRLKCAGFRWSRFSGCWYHKQSPASLAFAQTFAPVGRVTPCAPPITPPVQTPAPIPAAPVPLPVTFTPPMPTAPVPILNSARAEAPSLLRRRLQQFAR